MGMVCAVVFQRQGRLYYADPGSLTPSVGDEVLYPTDDGPEVAEVMWAPQYVSDDIGGLPVLAGMAGPDDRERAKVSRKKRAAARVAARRLIREHELPMKISGVDYVPDGDRTTVYFTAPHRVDFRALVRDLSATLHGRVELRQLSARDEARLTGGIGSCGRELCCSTFLVGFEVTTDEGDGTVVGHSVPSESVVVRMAADGRRSVCALASVCSSRKAYDARSDVVGDGAGDGATH